MPIKSNSWLKYSILVLLIFSGCFKQNDAAVEVSNIKIGVLYSAANEGIDSKKGIELAFEIINNKSPLGLPFAGTSGIPSLNGAKLELIFAEHNSDPKTAAKELERMHNELGVNIFMGCYQSAVTMAASEKAEELEVIFINPDSTSPILNKRGFKWFFRTTPDDDIFAENFFLFLNELRSRGLIASEKLGLIYENGLWGTGVSRAEEKYAYNNHYEISCSLPYNASTMKDASELASDIAASRAQILLQSSYLNDAVIIIKELKKQGYDPVAILGMDAGFNAAGFIDTLKEDAEFLLSREVWSLDLCAKKPLIKEVNDLFRTKYGCGMNGTSARGFTAAFVLADALQRAGSQETEQLRKALVNTNMNENSLIMPWKGVKFNEENQNILGRGLIVQMFEGRYYTVWPFDLAAKELVWPKPRWQNND